MLQFIPGTDFIFSGYSAVPKRDNLFGGGNFDAEDFDDYNVLQRDMQVDGGVLPGDGGRGARDPAAGRRGDSGRLRRAGLSRRSPTRRSRRRPSRTAATTCPSATPVADLAAADRFLAGDQGMLAVVAALRPPRLRAMSAANILEMGRQRAGRRLPASPSAHLRRDEFPRPAARSTTRTTTPAPAPATGWSGERWAKIQAIRQAQSPRDFIAPNVGARLAQARRDRAGAAQHAARGDRRGWAGLRRGADAHHRRAGTRGRAGGDPLRAWPTRG